MKERIKLLTEKRLFGVEEWQDKIITTCDLCKKKYETIETITFYPHIPSMDKTIKGEAPILFIKFGYKHAVFHCCESHTEKEIQEYVNRRIEEEHEKKSKEK